MSPGLSACKASFPFHTILTILTIPFAIPHSVIAYLRPTTGQPPATTTNHTSQPASHMSSLAGLVPPPRGLHFHLPSTRPTLPPRPRPTTRISATSPPHLLPHLFHAAAPIRPFYPPTLFLLAAQWSQRPGKPIGYSVPDGRTTLSQIRHSIPLHYIRYMNQSIHSHSLILTFPIAAVWARCGRGGAFHSN